MVDEFAGYLRVRRASKTWARIRKFRRRANGQEDGETAPCFARFTASQVAGVCGFSAGLPGLTRDMQILIAALGRLEPAQIRI